MVANGIIPGSTKLRADGFLLHIGSDTDTPRSVHADHLREILGNAGVPHSALPSAIGDEARLTRVFETVANDGIFSRIMTTPGERSRKGKKRTLSSFQRVIGKRDPDLVVRLTGLVKEGGAVEIEVLDPSLLEMKETILSQYTSTQGLISPSDFRGWLGAHATSAWSATPYARGAPFLPPWADEPALRLREIAATALGISIRLTGLVQSDDVIANVVDGLVSEVEKLRLDVDARLKKATAPGATWTAARMAELDVMIEKLGAYENLLGQNMDRLRSEVSTVRGTIGMAAILGSAVDEDDEVAA